MRYVWDRFDDYFPKDKTNLIRYQLISFMAGRLRAWDKASSNRVDLFIADSNFVRQRIETYYGRPSKVIFPPVNTDYFIPGASAQNEYYLLAGAMVPYKKGEIVIEAFRGLDSKLIVIGEGPDMAKLAKLTAENIEFTGWLNSEKLREYYRGCKALIFPGVEDFGIVPVEAQSCGKPVIAYGEGGILDTVVGPSIDNYETFKGFKSGLFFKEQTAQAVQEAVRTFVKMKFDSNAIVNHARQFSKERFSSELNIFINRAIETFRASGKEGLEERMIN
jgi:glycosyltransferase involved in cell wall biosynthesis